MLKNPKMRLEEIDSRLKELPKGTLTYKTINGKKQPYIQRTIQGKSQSVYVKLEGREKILLEFQERKSLEEEKKRLLKYYETLKDMLHSTVQKCCLQLHQLYYYLQTKHMYLIPALQRQHLR